jgi:acyl-coenzyme A synthetase/AMP-(fatty) acid ligase
MINNECLIERIIKIRHFRNIVNSENVFDSYLSYVLSILNSVDVYTYESEQIQLFENKFFQINDSKDIRAVFLVSSSVVYFKTSGTTGVPKEIAHDVNTLFKRVRLNEKQLNQVWGYCYSTMHISGFFLFAQAFLSNSSLVDLRNLSKTDLTDTIKKNKIGRISAPTTFYKLNLPLAYKCDSVLSITNGGEPLDEHSVKRIKVSFPSAEVKNIYAATEFGSILVSNSEFFSIPIALENRIKILDNIICVHRSLVSKSVTFEGEWYKTFDKVEWLNDKQFKIVGRESDFVNVMGHLVSLMKVENVFLGIEGVRACQVITKPHSVFGELIFCNLVLENKLISKVQLIEIAQLHLRNYELPSKINLVDKIDTTLSGKIKRSYV